MTCAESLAPAVPRQLHIAGVVTLCVVVWTNAHAATPAASLGFDFRRGAEGQETRAATAAGTLGFDSGDLLLGAMRYDDSVVGPGSAVIVGGGLALQAPLAMRVVGTRFAGDESYRGWRLKLGPTWSFAGGGVGVFYVHDENNQGPATESGAGELSVPLARGWTGKLSGSYSRSGDLSGFAAAAGVAFDLVPHLELASDIGLAQGQIGTGASPPGGGILGGLLGTRGPTERGTRSSLEATTSLSVRITLP